MSIVIIDDEQANDLPGLMRALKKIEQRKPGLETFGPYNPLHGLRRLYDGHCSLLVLDYRMEPGILSEEGARVDTAGQWIWHRIRELYGLRDLPIVLLTHHYDPSRKVMTAGGPWNPEDKNLVRLSKSNSGLLEETIGRLSGGKEFRIENVPTTENPSLAPYYVRDMNTDMSVKVCFDELKEDDVAKLNESNGDDGWSISRDLKARLFDESSGTRVYKLVADNDNTNNEILGVFSTNDLDSDEVDLSTVKCARRTFAKDSEFNGYAGIERVFAARLLRQVLHDRFGSGAEHLSEDSQVKFSFETDASAASLTHTLENVGSQLGEGRLEIQISRVEAFINEVSDPDRWYNVQVTAFEEEIICS